MPGAQRFDVVAVGAEQVVGGVGRREDQIERQRHEIELDEPGRPGVGRDDRDMLLPRSLLRAE